MSAFQVDVQFNGDGGIKFGSAHVHTDRADGEKPFCTISFGPMAMDQDTLMGPEVRLYFDRVEDIAALASALHQLGRDFAEKIGPDPAEVPIEAEATGPLTAPLTAPLEDSTGEDSSSSVSRCNEAAWSKECPRPEGWPA